MALIVGNILVTLPSGKDAQAKLVGNPPGVNNQIGAFITPPGAANPIHTPTVMFAHLLSLRCSIIPVISLESDLHRLYPNSTLHELDRTGPVMRRANITPTDNDIKFGLVATSGMTAFHMSGLTVDNDL